jgi:hypothetical protein
MIYSIPRFIRIGSYELMVERRASLLKPSQWFRPQAERLKHGELLCHIGPFEIAFGPYKA